MEEKLSWLFTVRARGRCCAADTHDLKGIRTLISQGTEGWSLLGTTAEFHCGKSIVYCQAEPRRCLSVDRKPAVPLTREVLPNLPISCFLFLVIGPLHQPGAGTLARAFGMEHPSAKKMKRSFCPEHGALLQPCELTRLWGQGAAPCQLELKGQGQKKGRKRGGRRINLVGGGRKQNEGPSGQVEAPGHPQASPPSPTSLPLWKALLVTV